MPGDPATYLDASWERDLAHHTYLGERITVLCPMVEVDAVPSSHVAFTDPRFTFVALPPPTGTLRYVGGGSLLRAIVRIWREVGRAGIVFAGLVEHPIPLGWFAFPAARLRGAVAYTFLESTPWRPVPGVASSWKLRLRSGVTTRLNALVLRLIDFAAITQPAYATLLPARTPHVLTPASWFLLEEMAPENAIDARATAAAARPGAPPGDRGPVVLFAARFDEAKGVRVLLDALDRLDHDGRGPLTIRILGSGRLETEVDARLATLTGGVRVERIAPVRYGPEFFRLFDGVDCVVVPNLSDEQPRIVFDAAAQGVATIGADTTGVASIVEPGVTGTVVPLGSAEPLAAALGALRDPRELQRFVAMGANAWRAACTYDHVAMHRRRAAFIGERYGGGAGSGRRSRRRLGIRVRRP